MGRFPAASQGQVAEMRKRMTGVWADVLDGVDNTSQSSLSVMLYRGACLLCNLLAFIYAHPNNY